LSHGEYVFVPEIVIDTVSLSYWVFVKSNVTASVIDGMRDPEQVLG
jgi:hypothetical protein